MSKIRIRSILVRGSWNMQDVIIAEFTKGKVKKDDLESYQKCGVWSLWAKDSVGMRKCLEVAKTVNIHDEIRSALSLLSNKDDLKCMECSDTYNARRRNKEYSAAFKIHKCKKCYYVSNIRTKSWKRNPRYIDKYKDMLVHYEDFQFVLVEADDAMMNDKCRLEREKKYALENQALYWWG